MKYYSVIPVLGDAQQIEVNMIKFIALMLFMVPVMADDGRGGIYDNKNHHYDVDPIDGTDGMDGPMGLQGVPGDNGSQGNGFGLITQIYDPDYKGWQSSVGMSQFDGDSSYMFGTAKDMPHGILNINVGSSQGKQGAGAAWSFKY